MRDSIVQAWGFYKMVVSAVSTLPSVGGTPSSGNGNPETVPPDCVAIICSYASSEPDRVAVLIQVFNIKKPIIVTNQLRVDLKAEARVWSFSLKQVDLDADVDRLCVDCDAEPARLHIQGKMLETLIGLPVEEVTSLQGRASSSFSLERALATDAQVRKAKALEGSQKMKALLDLYNKLIRKNRIGEAFAVAISIPDSEKLANIVDKYLDQAVPSLAEAERKASLIPDPIYRTRALKNIVAKHLERAYPDFGEVERIAKLIPDTPEKSQALGAIAEAVAVHNFPIAQSIANSIPDPKYKDFVLATILRAQIGNGHGWSTCKIGVGFGNKSAGY